MSEPSDLETKKSKIVGFYSHIEKHSQKKCCKGNCTKKSCECFELPKPPPGPKPYISSVRVRIGRHEFLRFSIFNKSHNQSCLTDITALKLIDTGYSRCMILYHISTRWKKLYKITFCQEKNKKKYFPFQ